MRALQRRFPLMHREKQSKKHYDNQPNYAIEEGDKTCRNQVYHQSQAVCMSASIPEHDAPLSATLLTDQKNRLSQIGIIYEGVNPL